MFSKETSGDLIADRRFALAQMLWQRGETEAALDLLQQTMEITPSWPPLPFRCGEILMELGRLEEAAESFKTCLRLDQEDRMGAEIKLSLLGAMPQPEILPAHYVKTLFDDYAPRFDSALVESLSYRAPQLIADIIEHARPYDETTAERILDLGCGTGLAGETLYKRASWLEGIDLSSGMLEIADKRKIYNELKQADITAALTERASDKPGLCDIVVSADVFVYIGELSLLFRMIAACMKTGGLFAFTVQKLPEENPASWTLGPDHRYAHNAAYLERCLDEAGLRLISRKEETLRTDRGQDVNGYIMLAEKRPETLTEWNPAMKAIKKKDRDHL